MAEPTGIDALAAGLRADHGPPVEERNALTVDPEKLTVQELLWSMTFLQGEVKRLTAELDELRGQNTQTEANFEIYVESAILRERELSAALAVAKAVMTKALGEVEHEEVVHLLNRYLSARPSTTEEGEG